MPLVCSDWAKRLNHRLLRVGSFYSPGRTPPRPEGADVRELMLDLRAAAAEGRDVLPEVRRALEAAPALAKLDAFLTRDQLLRFAEAVTGDPELRSTRRISSLGLSVFPASSSSGRAAEAEAAEAGEMLSRLPGEGGRFCSFALTCQFGRPHRDQRYCEMFLQKFSGRVFAMQVNEVSGGRRKREREREKKKKKRKKKKEKRKKLTFSSSLLASSKNNNSHRT